MNIKAFPNQPTKILGPFFLTYAAAQVCCLNIILDQLLTISIAQLKVFGHPSLHLGNYQYWGKSRKCGTLIFAAILQLGISSIRRGQVQHLWQRGCRHTHRKNGTFGWYRIKVAWINITSLNANEIHTGNIVEFLFGSLSPRTVTRIMVISFITWKLQILLTLYVSISVLL